MSDLIVMTGVRKRYLLPTEPRSFALRFMKINGRSPRYVEALSALDLRVGKGEAVHLLGRNGAGKTTLLRLAAGITRPSSGRIERRGRTAVVLGLGVAFHPELSGIENVILNGIVYGLDFEEVKRRMDRILDFAGIGDLIHAPVQTYSSGMAMRLGFAIAIHTDFDLLVVDEALSVGDREFQSKCLDHLKTRLAEGRSILSATHDWETAKTLGGAGVLLDRGACLFQGPVDEAARRAGDLAESAP
jgi:ABC-type polysaccharide/polyol phosphate transport system ATPase subunit